jgi:Sigma-70, region 4
MIESELEAYYLARARHAKLLRREGLTFDEIGFRLGVSRERARQLSLRSGRRPRGAFYMWPEPESDISRKVRLEALQLRADAAAASYWQILRRG